MSNGIQCRKITGSGGFFGFGIGSLVGFALVDQVEIFDRSFQKKSGGLFASQQLLSLALPVAQGGVVFTLAAKFIKEHGTARPCIKGKQTLGQIAERMRLGRLRKSFTPIQQRLPLNGRRIT